MSIFEGSNSSNGYGTIEEVLPAFNPSSTHTVFKYWLLFSDYSENVWNYFVESKAETPEKIQLLPLHGSRAKKPQLNVS